ncbi:MAG: DedA family protein, partial [Arenimonas sp.]|nr:DedA family protein [Arenimonas sp.]
MAVFKNLYERAILWAAHPRSSYFLTLLSFIEAIFFPVPPEVMLAPMSLARPKKAFWFASLSLFGSMT